MEEEPQAEAPVSLEDIEKIFGELVEQMASATKKMSMLGKRMREEAFSTEDLEREYLALPVDQRPSWFEFVASQSEATAEHATAEKFATKKASVANHTQDGHTQ